MIFLYMTWHQMLSLAMFVFSSSSLTRKVTITIGMKIFKAWNFCKSLALVSVNPPTTRILIGAHQSLADYSPKEAKPYDE